MLPHIRLTDVQTLEHSRRTRSYPRRRSRGPRSASDMGGTAQYLPTHRCSKDSSASVTGEASQSPARSQQPLQRPQRRLIAVRSRLLEHPTRFEKATSSPPSVLPRFPASKLRFGPLLVADSVAFALGSMASADTGLGMRPMGKD